MCSLLTHTCWWQGSRIPSYSQLSFQAYRSSIGKVVKTYMQLVLLFWRHSWRPAAFTSEEHQWSYYKLLKGSFIHAFLIQLLYTATHKIRATQFVVQHWLYLRTTLQKVPCVCHTPPPAHTPPAENTHSFRIPWQGALKAQGEKGRGRESVHQCIVNELSRSQVQQNLLRHFKS